MSAVVALAEAPIASISKHPLRKRSNGSGTKKKSSRGPARTTEIPKPDEGATVDMEAMDDGVLAAPPTPYLARTALLQTNGRPSRRSGATRNVAAKDERMLEGSIATDSAEGSTDVEPAVKRPKEESPHDRVTDSDVSPGQRDEFAVLPATPPLPASLPPRWT